jgi:plasmid stability protein
MRNVTISLPEEVYRRARIRAAERDSSVSAMVRDFLTSLGDEDSEFAQRKKLQDDVLGSIRAFRAGKRLTRDEVHRRSGPR